MDKEANAFQSTEAGKHAHRESKHAQHPAVQQTTTTTKTAIHQEILQRVNAASLQAGMREHDFVLKKHVSKATLGVVFNFGGNSSEPIASVHGDVDIVGTLPGVSYVVPGDEPTHPDHWAMGKRSAAHKVFPIKAEVTGWQFEDGKGPVTVKFNSDAKSTDGKALVAFGGGHSTECLTLFEHEPSGTMLHLTAQHGHVDPRELLSRMETSTMKGVEYRAIGENHEAYPLIRKILKAYNDKLLKDDPEAAREFQASVDPNSVRFNEKFITVPLKIMEKAAEFYSEQLGDKNDMVQLSTVGLKAFPHTPNVRGTLYVFVEFCYLTREDAELVVTKLGLVTHGKVAAGALENVHSRDQLIQVAQNARSATNGNGGADDDDDDFDDTEAHGGSDDDDDDPDDVPVNSRAMDFDY